MENTEGGKREELWSAKVRHTAAGADLQQLCIPRGRGDWGLFQSKGHQLTLARQQIHNGQKDVFLCTVYV